ncbi:hypothetical protein SAMN05443636_2708 [Halobaculum gomorrense]|uniref:Uncharacterized protein n=1 Tax=Halobaculum gomorrense TaxID=43928 RepID=A0A1M5TGW3_9EURY|nr:hypothetical protein SAMN05443636_2708 [Halobaculum gomorrense]
MTSEVRESLESNRTKAVGGAFCFIAALIAFLFVVRGSENGSIMNITGWLLVALGNLIAGLLMTWESVQS